MCAILSEIFISLICCCSENLSYLVRWLRNLFKKYLLAELQVYHQRLWHNTRGFVIKLYEDGLFHIVGH